MGIASRDAHSFEGTVYDCRIPMDLDGDLCHGEALPVKAGDHSGLFVCDWGEP